MSLSPNASPFLQDREFVELEVPYNGQPNRPGSASPPQSRSPSLSSHTNFTITCCGRRFGGKSYQVGKKA
ncbi:Potassium voltage-gated channel protein Shal [Portunus trituberculatus]|uniref:Potassium voltage-gated channel protein Shal n=1 Tax=Portunus trituberculatus TaxID=210409 RepID=A0A5B7KEP7_PORTR|nr:Potassium voltage-gated channel protein Shal [Portunus trituberculatus]